MSGLTTDPRDFDTVMIDGVLYVNGADYADLAARCERLKEDAARYAYLRDNCKREWQSDMSHDRGKPSLDIEFEAPGWDLDAAIDTARGLLSGEGEGHGG